MDFDYEGRLFFRGMVNFVIEKEGGWKEFPDGKNHVYETQDWTMEECFQGPIWQDQRFKQRSCKTGRGG